ncbi:hypothetical protein GCM10014715_18080 [Streptomyces spiralis]|uniref:Uncharacterized protein n=1 Tax=Streptomyces spiralis TaxID=66376 RepID=A0A918ZRG3_9ACTN|nr:hypothetical protein GCM10014715_18080 [Streptomyces spiralis]
MAEEAPAFAASLEQSMGLVCFDPQYDKLRPPRVSQGRQHGSEVIASAGYVGGPKRCHR